MNSDAQPDFSIHDEELDAQTRVVAVQGELDVLTAPHLKKVINQALESDTTHLAIDFSETTFIDSTTLGVLIGTLKRLRLAGGSMVLVCNDPAIIKLIQITGLHHVFEIKASREQAVSFLSGE